MLFLLSFCFLLAFFISILPFKLSSHFFPSFACLPSSTLTSLIVHFFFLSCFPLYIFQPFFASSSLPSFFTFLSLSLPSFLPSWCSRIYVFLSHSFYIPVFPLYFLDSSFLRPTFPSFFIFLFGRRRMAYTNITMK